MKIFILPLCLILFSCVKNVVTPQAPYEEMKTTGEETSNEEAVSIAIEDTIQNLDAIPQLATTKITEEEFKLYSLIMIYRKEHGLPVIPLSKSLTFVAQQHCLDLVKNKPDVGEICNAHSWSGNGIWTGCCYTEDHAQANCMWSKPAELTTYTNLGFEIACGDNDHDYSGFVMTAAYALKSWMSSPGHNAVILNEGVWEPHPWQAIGIGIKDGFATVWFGEQIDSAGEPMK